MRMNKISLFFVIGILLFSSVAVARIGELSIWDADGDGVLDDTEMAIRDRNLALIEADQSRNDANGGTGSSNPCDGLTGLSLQQCLEGNDPRDSGVNDAADDAAARAAAGEEGDADDRTDASDARDAALTTDDPCSGLYGPEYDACRSAGIDDSPGADADARAAAGEEGDADDRTDASDARDAALNPGDDQGIPSCPSGYSDIGDGCMGPYGNIVEYNDPVDDSPGADAAARADAGSSTVGLEYGYGDNYGFGYGATPTQRSGLDPDSFAPVDPTDEDNRYYSYPGLEAPFYRDNNGNFHSSTGLAFRPDGSQVNTGYSCEGRVCTDSYGNPAVLGPDGYVSPEGSVTAVNPDDGSLRTTPPEDRDEDDDSTSDEYEDVLRTALNDLSDEELANLDESMLPDDVRKRIGQEQAQRRYLDQPFAQTMRNGASLFRAAANVFFPDAYNGWAENWRNTYLDKKQERMEDRQHLISTLFYGEEYFSFLCYANQWGPDSRWRGSDVNNARVCRSEACLFLAPERIGFAVTTGTGSQTVLGTPTYLYRIPFSVTPPPCTSGPREDDNGDEIDDSCEERWKFDVIMQKDDGTEVVYKANISVDYGNSYDATGSSMFFEESEVLYTVAKLRFTDGNPRRSIEGYTADNAGGRTFAVDILDGGTIPDYEVSLGDYGDDDGGDNGGDDGSGGDGGGGDERPPTDDGTTNDI
jgi:hypothetical protein